MRERRRGRARGCGGGGGWRHGQADQEPRLDREVQGPKAVFLTFDELEALRLVDLEDMYQEEAARTLGISRRTLWADLMRARRKVATALVNGWPIRIIGGSQVVMDSRPGASPDEPIKAEKGQEEK